MRRFLPCLLFILLALPAFGAGKGAQVSAPLTQGGLICFSVTPDVATSPPGLSCDALCAARQAACSGVANGAMNPPATCEDPPKPNFAVCRCCKVAR